MAKTATKVQEYLGTGRRKSSTARVRLREGTGKIRINGRELEDYFPNLQHRKRILEPLELVEMQEKVDIRVRVRGGGMTGQADAVRLGIARALKAYNEEFHRPLRQAGMLTVDARVVERKKYGLHKARRATQFSKR